MNTSTLTMLKDFGRDIEWLIKNYDKILEEYEGKWVAVYKEKIIEYDEDLDILIKKLRMKGLKPEIMVIEYITSEEIEAIL